MSISKKMQTQGGKPFGLFGTLIGSLMNILHGSIYQWGLQDIPLRENDICLDIGCGGGRMVRVLGEKAGNGKVYGLDHSAEMVKLSRRLNRSLIAKGIVEISQGRVSALPYSNAYFDVVTAFETIQYWPAVKNDLKEIKRVLKPAGIFLIVNRYPPEDSKWSGFLQLKNAKAYEEEVLLSGFKNIFIDTGTKAGWIKAVAYV